MARILVVDDDNVFAQLICRALQTRGHDVISADDGESAMRTFRKDNFDAVVCDLVMPEREGVQTIRELRQVRPDLPIVAISGGLSSGRFVDVDILSMVEKLGADATLKKPFQLSALCKAVEDAIATRAAKAAAARA